MRALKQKPARRSPIEDGADRRPVSAPFIWAEPRNLFFFRTGRLIGAHGEEICEIIALAESGAIIRSNSEYLRADPCSLELNSAHRLTGVVAWSDGGAMGLEFTDTKLVRDVLSRRESSLPYRPPRLALRCSLEIQLGSKRLATTSHDISESGIKVDLPTAEAEGKPAVVALDEIGPVSGRVQWWREGRAGIKFDCPIPAKTFTRWLTPRIATPGG